MSAFAPITGDSNFEREKWQAELRLRERELSLREDELRFKNREQQRSRWANPLVLAVLAATLAAVGNAAVAYINGAAQRELETARTTAQGTIEETRAEASRILELIKTGDPISARRNLEFLSETGLITNRERHAAIKEYLKKTAPKEGPVLPRPRSTDSLMEELARINDPAELMKRGPEIMLEIQKRGLGAVGDDRRLKDTWEKNLPRD